MRFRCAQFDNQLPKWQPVVKLRRASNMSRSKSDQLTDLVLTVFRLHGVLTDWGDAFASVEGLSTARWQMLGAVALVNQPLTAPQIAARMGKQLNALVQEGLMEAHPNPMHKRSSLYDLTPHGRAAFDAIDARWNSHAAQAAAAFKSTDLETAERVLAAVTDLYAVTRKEDGHEA
jgi:DNA-binding MarR family transcriptional regulator